ncbi:MAG: DUF362 domain-containing protein [bacterium]
MSGDSAKRIPRRDFIRAGVIAAAGLSIPPGCARAETGAEKNTAPARPGDKSTVVIARNEKVWNGSSLDETLTGELLFGAVRIISGEKSDKAAWKRFFSPFDQVGVKVNCLGGRSLSPREELVNAVCAGIQEAGVPPTSILIWDSNDRDLRKAGYRIRADGGGIGCFGTDNPRAGYDRELTSAGQVASRVSRIASTMCSALVNVPVLKDHDLAGVSCSLKNYYGAIHNPNKYHANGCDPFIADVYSMPALGGKTRLVVCDATTAQYNGGPGFKSHWSWRHNAIIVSTDPVALDTVALSIIERKRRENGLPTLAEAERPARHVLSAAAPPRNLGAADMKRIKIIEIS